MAGLSKGHRSKHLVSSRIGKTASRCLPRTSRPFTTCVYLLTSRVHTCLAARIVVACVYIAALYIICGGKAPPIRTSARAAITRLRVSSLTGGAELGRYNIYTHAHAGGGGDDVRFVAIPREMTRKRFLYCLFLIRVFMRCNRVPGHLSNCCLMTEFSFND